jgi:hypothetical protein
VPTDGVPPPTHLTVNHGRRGAPPRIYPRRPFCFGAPPPAEPIPRLRHVAAALPWTWRAPDRRLARQIKPGAPNRDHSGFTGRLIFPSRGILLNGDLRLLRDGLFFFARPRRSALYGTGGGHGFIVRPSGSFVCASPHA